jgi:hypothetical protein
VYLLGRVEGGVLLCCNGDVALQRLSRGECPAGSTTALVLDGRYNVLVTPIKRGRKLVNRHMGMQRGRRVELFSIRRSDTLVAVMVRLEFFDGVGSEVVDAHLVGPLGFLVVSDDLLEITIEDRTAHAKLRRIVLLAKFGNVLLESVRSFG